MDRKELQRVASLLEMPGMLSYVEPCGGSADMLSHRHPADLETFNDRADDVVVFFRSLRENMPAALEAIGGSGRDREDLVRCARPAKSELEQARRFFVRSQQAVRGDWNSRHAVMKLVDRLRRVQIECIPSLRCIGDFDTPATMFYVRIPPGSTPLWNKMLARKLSSVEGKAAVHSRDGSQARLYADWTEHDVGRGTVWTNYTPMSAKTLFGPG